MSKSTKQAPSATASDDVSGSGRLKTTKENKLMNTKPLYGVIYFALKISLVIAGVTLITMPFVHFIVDMPLYQIVGGVLLIFLSYLELYAYFAKPATKKQKKSTEPHSAIESLLIET